MINQRAQQSGINNDTSERVNSLIGDNNQRIYDERVSIEQQGGVIMNEQKELKSDHVIASDKFKEKHSEAVVNQGQKDPRTAEMENLFKEHLNKESK